MQPDHTEMPLPERSFDDELAWSAIFKQALSKTKEKAEIYKSGLDVNLIFVRWFIRYGSKSS